MNTSTIHPPPKPAITGMQTNHHKSALAMELACEKLIGMCCDGTLDHDAFMHTAVMTLTFTQAEYSWKAAKQELQKLLKTLQRRYGDDFRYVWVQERHQSGGIHFHVLLTLPFDCRTGSDIHTLLRWKEIEENAFACDRIKDCLPFLNDSLRDELIELRKILPRYGIGRFDILPILTDSESVIAYLKKGIRRHLSVRHVEDKGARLWGCSKNVHVCATQEFSLYTPFTTKLRKRIAAWGKSHHLNDIDEARHKVGPHWFFIFRNDYERLGDDALLQRVGHSGLGLSRGIRSNATYLLGPLKLIQY